MLEEPENNPHGLRVIKTARTEEAINAAARKGFRPLVKPVIPSPKVGNMLAVYQHKETGEILVCGDCRMFLGKEYECVIPFRHYYTYHFPEPFAAYLVPPDIQEGEKVWLEDIIEDIVMIYGNQGYHPRLDAHEAIWKKGNFKILFDPKTDAPTWIG